MTGEPKGEDADMRVYCGRQEQGQVLALFAIGLFAIVAMVALVIDGGNAYAHQRISQNGTDAAAQAGAVVLAERLAGKEITDAMVKGAVEDVLREMDMDAQASVAVYTDIEGNPLGPIVGSASEPRADAAGVAVKGDLPFDTFFARALGIFQMNAVTNATAVVGYTTDLGGPILPITPPENIVLDCGRGQSDEPIWAPIPEGDTEPPKWEMNTLYVIPLCTSGPGNVGWLDWSTTAGGKSELRDNIWPPPADPVTITVPSWQHFVEPAVGMSNLVQTALWNWDLQTVGLPIFDATCNSDPGGPNLDCPTGPGIGANTYYHFPAVAAFELCGTHPDGTIPGWCTDARGNRYGHGSYVSGNDTKNCNLAKNTTGCLVGRFVDLVRGGNVTGILSEDPTDSDTIGVQLLK